MQDTSFDTALKLHMQGDIRGARNLYEHILLNTPDHVNALHLSGVAAHQLGLNDLAVQKIRKAIDLDGTQSDFYNNLGEAFRGLKRLPEAIEAYKKSISLAPRNLNALNNLGIALHWSHQFEAAENTFLEAIRLEPNDAAVYINLGMLYLDNKHYQKAINTLQSVLNRDGKNVDAMTWLGIALFESGNEQQAIATLRHAIEIDPLNLSAHENLKRIHWYRNETNLVDTSFEMACKIFPEHYQCWINLARAKIISQKYSNALSAAEKALELRPNSYQALALQGESLFALGQVDKSISAYRQSLKLNNEEHSILENFGKALIVNKDFVNARKFLLKGLKLAPRRSAILGYLSLVLNELDDPLVSEWVDHEKYVKSAFIEPPPGFKNLEQFNQKLHQELLTKHQSETHALGQSMRGGTQNRNNLFENPTGMTALLKVQIKKVVDQYIANLSRDSHHPFLAYRNPNYVFTGAWSTIIKQGGYDGSHIHNEGWMSGTYYVRVPPLGEKQKAHSEGYIQFGRPPHNLASQKNDTVKTFKPEVGKVVVFPSYYWHGVNAFSSQSIRHSVSYDII